MCNFEKNLIVIFLQLAQVQSLAQTGGVRTPVNHHQSFTDKLVEEALQFPHGASPPPTHLNNLHIASGKFYQFLTFQTSRVLYHKFQLILEQPSINYCVVLPLQPP